MPSFFLICEVTRACESCRLSLCQYMYAMHAAGALCDVTPSHSKPHSQIKFEVPIHTVHSICGLTGKRTAINARNDHNKNAFGKVQPAGTFPAMDK